MKYGKKLISLITAAAAVISLSTVPMAKTYNDLDEITSHVNLKVPEKLAVNRPAGEGFTNANSYFIMGSSDPDKALSVNGQTVTTRGARGSFGVYVQLNNGKNLFQFQQGGDTVDVTITKGGEGTVTKINTVRDMAPSYDCATLSGETITLSCVAPSGAKVSAAVGGKTVQLQQTAQAQDGVPADFRGTTAAEDVSGTEDLGKVTYMMTYNGKTVSYQSEGRVMVTGKGYDLMVQVKNNASCLYTGDDMGYFESVARIGAVDYVSQIGKKCYELSSGGWIPKETVTPLTGNVAVKNKVTKTDFEVGAKGETIRITGTTHPMFRETMSNDELSIKLMNTTGVSRPDVESSKLLSRMRVTEENGDTILTFTLDGERDFWGYDISYKNGVTSVYLKYKPIRGNSDTPLSGVTVAVDAGHGGSDPGALGFPMTNGATEAEINLASAIAVQKRLESLGATVVMTRTGDDDVTMNDRMTQTRKADADFFVSLHSNSAGYEVNGNNTSGTEVYYYFDNSKRFASLAAQNVSHDTGRQARGAKFSNYRVTLNNFCPSVLVEMGFVTNPKEYDEMTSRDGIFELANAIGDSVVAAL